MFEIKGFIPRKYQENIAETCKNSNTLVILPTGLGKTKIAVLLAVNELNKFPNSKVLITSPTKPLSSQLSREFASSTNIEKISLLTGSVSPKKRAEIWESSTVISATPQTVRSDLENNRITLSEVKLLIVDECHRSKMRYASTILAKDFQGKILALTASPGNTKEQINEICQNLNIEKVEIRTEDDEDVKEYLQKKDIKYVNVDLPEELLNLQKLIKEVKDEKLKDLKKVGFTKPVYLINKKDLLMLQKRLQSEIRKNNYMAFYGISLVAQIIKIDHLLGLLETQGINQLKEYLEKLKAETTKASKTILNHEKIKKVINEIDNLNKDFRHPKIIKLKEIIKEELILNPNSKILIFANFRNSVMEVVNELKKESGVRPIFLLGQKEGITQKQQIQTIKLFEDNEFNVLVATSIAEEGLDLKGGANLAVFYDSVPSEIRNIQRKGRVGRLDAGKIIFLLTKNSRDIAYFWTSKRKETKMKNIIKGIQAKQEIQKTLK